MAIDDFIKTEAINLEKRMFVARILGILVAYIGITFWLNAIRSTAPIWLVWALIIPQFTLYFLIFSVSYQRSKECGFKHFSFFIFLILCVLGRVNDWELLIIPVTVIVVLVISARTKKISNEFENKFEGQPSEKN